MPRTPRPYELWDVFTTEPFSGNPLAVVPDASGLTDVQMQRIANEFNLSETSFVLPSGTADVRARYFTPARESGKSTQPPLPELLYNRRMGRAVTKSALVLCVQQGVTRRVP